MGTADTTVDSQPDRMPCIEAPGRTVSRVPTRRPFAGVTIERRGVESQPGNHGERMTLARVDRDPFSGPALAVSAKFC